MRAPDWKSGSYCEIFSYLSVSNKMLYTITMNKLIVQTDVLPGYIDLGAGNPSLELLPMEMIARAAERYFSDGDRRTLQYGVEQGNGYFLEALIGILESESEGDVHPDSLMVTSGASSALDLLCTLYTQAGDVIFVEEPTYFLARGIFSDHQLQVHAIPLDQHGMDIEALEEKLNHVKPRFLYTIPTFHNPASVTLTQQRRERLINLAEKHGFLVIADEVYRFLSYDQELPLPLASFTAVSKQVISINSFSKILAPGLRLGWIQAHPRMITRLAGCGLVDSGGGLNPFTSAIVYYLIESGDLTNNICGLRDIYKQRLDGMAEALDYHLPEAEYTKPQGGYYFWVRLPGKDTVQLRDLVRKRKVDYRPGNFFSSRQGLKDFLRLSISFHDPEQIDKGIRVLAESLQDQ